MFWSFIICICYLLSLYFKQKELRALTTAGKLHVLNAFTPYQLNLIPAFPNDLPHVESKAFGCEPDYIGINNTLIKK